MELKALYRETNERELKELFNGRMFDFNWQSGTGETSGAGKIDESPFPYKLEKTKECYYYLLGTLYPWAVEIAKMQGGDLILNIDETKCTGKMQYEGKYLFCTPGDSFLTNFLISAMTMADQYKFEGKDSLVHLEFIFEFENMVKMKEYANEIEKMRQKIKEIAQR